MCTWFHDEREARFADQYFLDLVLRQDPRLLEWRSEGDRSNLHADYLLHQFTKGEPIFGADQYRKLVVEFQKIMLYGTVIPYRIPSAINSLDEERRMEEAVIQALHLFEPLRAQTRYPQLVQSIFQKYWEFAFQECGLDPLMGSLLTPQEFQQFLDDPTSVDRSTLSKREAWCCFWTDGLSSDIHITTDREAKRDFEIPILCIEASNELQGRTVYPGKVQGKIQIVNTIEDMQKCSPGCIVVSINTSPSIMPVLKQCAAIITDEGGITCHAAIVSRELGKPCIIGTKIATKVLKDGDKVEVDAEKGIVRILKRN